MPPEGIPAQPQTGQSRERLLRDHSIFMMDPDGNITTWNAEAEKIIGCEEAEVLGRNFSVIFTAEDLQAGK